MVFKCFCPDHQLRLNAGVRKPKIALNHVRKGGGASKENCEET